MAKLPGGPPGFGGDLEPGDFAWALGKGKLWWPARIRKASMAAGSHSALYVSYLGSGGSTWHHDPSSTLTPYIRPSSTLSTLHSLGFTPDRNPPSRALTRAISSASASIGRCLETYLARPCFSPVEPLFSSAAARKVPAALVNAITRTSSQDILQLVRAFAVDGFGSQEIAKDATAMARSWITPFRRGAKFSIYHGIPHQENTTLMAVGKKRKSLLPPPTTNPPMGAMHPRNKRKKK